MTRKGFTPFFQSNFETVLDILVTHKASPQQWIHRSSITSDITEDKRVLYGELTAEGFSSIRFEIKSIDFTGLEEYYVTNGENLDDFRFGVIELSTGSRRRKFHPGLLQFDIGAKKIDATWTIDFSLENLPSEFTLEPVFVAKTDLIDPRSKIAVTSGTILGSSSLIRIMEKRAENLLGDLFVYEWKSFEKDDNLDSGELCDVDFEAEPPIILLNEDLQGLHYTLDQRDNPKGIQPKKIRARRAIDTQIAVDVLATCGASIVIHIQKEASFRREEDPETEYFGDIFDSLSDNERVLLNGFSHLFCISDEILDGEELCHEIATVSDLTLREHLVSGMPRKIRKHMGAELGIAEILTLAEIIDV